MVEWKKLCECATPAFFYCAIYSIIPLYIIFLFTSSFFRKFLQANGLEGKESPTKVTSDIPVPPVNPGILQMCGRFSFPWLLTLSVVQLAIYLNKLYQDSAAVGKYFAEKNFNYCLVSAACLFVPAIVYIIYIVAAYIKEQEDPEPKEVGTRVVHGLLLVPWQIKG